jgi:hypothetical protein
MDHHANPTRTGRCLCGGVRFQIELTHEAFEICHCSACRRWSAGPFMGVHGQGPGKFLSDDTLAWFASSPWAERGFCTRCGSSLFYRLSANHDAMLAAAVDALDDAGGITLDRHIFFDTKPDRYEFSDDRPRLSEAETLASFGMAPG